MLIARLDKAGLSYGTRQIFAGLDLSLNDGEKIGLVGPNGVGKSSLLRLLAGLERPAGGERIARRGAKFAYLPQEYAGEGAPSAVAEVLLGRPDLLALERELEAIEASLADPALAEDFDAFGRALERQAAALEAYEKGDGPRLRNDARGLLERLGLPPAAQEQPLTVLSGGQRKLVGLARCLIGRPDLLLLDEPDNHLDLAGKELLGATLRGFAGAIVIVSHDRYLLDDTIGRIAELDGGRLTLYEGNYSSYVTQRELALLRQQEQYVAQQKEIARLEAAVARFKLWASMVIDERHIKQARNKQRQIDRMDKVERPVLSRRKLGLTFRPGQRGGQKVIEARHLAKSFADHLVLLDADFTLWRGERIGIVGPNGVGKSVLFSLLLGEDTPTEGEVWVGPSIAIGSYAQGHETLDPAQTALDFVRGLRPMHEEEAVGILGRFLFGYGQVRDPIGRLSGGEKSRLQLLRLMIGGFNCLLLDEPTNHLDIAATEVLEGAIDRFDGTVLTISHDRYFLDRICTRIFELSEGEIVEYIGGYSDYVEEKRRRQEEAERAAAEAARRRVEEAAARTRAAKVRRSARAL
ncbi:MAG: Bis-ABC ATPase Uup [uncultured Thermomicrobiales bacterium]|uniref:Bis-ABC ATPase Uup n=1 Tax=uncultured Thermomicrobiales bacterium TaxID=1645740 RepID=A0A6J4V651_9BACT|nr:MAG: Bis-ABC ATPase Uup [uncultured Thermomicrobiales bacterium]